MLYRNPVRRYFVLCSHMQHLHLHLYTHSTTTMPRVSEKAQALQGVEEAIEITAWCYLLASSFEEEDDVEEDLEDLLDIQEVIAS